MNKRLPVSAASGGASGEPGRRLVCVTNIPTPYRVHLFNALSEELARRSIDFSVEFLAARSASRSWSVDLSRARFDYAVAGGWHARFRGYAFDINLSVIRSQVRQPPT